VAGYIENSLVKLRIEAVLAKKRKICPGWIYTYAGIGFRLGTGIGAVLVFRSGGGRGVPIGLFKDLKSVVALINL